MNYNRSTNVVLAANGWGFIQYRLNRQNLIRDTNIMVKKKVNTKPKSKALNKALVSQKAFKIWKQLLSKEPKWTFDYGLNQNNYVALAENPKPHFYTVCHEPTTINTATGMFRFPNEKVADKFIKMMGASIKHLCPKISFG